MAKYSIIKRNHNLLTIFFFIGFFSLRLFTVVNNVELKSLFNSLIIYGIDF